MISLKKFIAVSALILLVAAGWMFPFEYIHLQSGGMMRANRFTGQTCMMGQVPNPKYPKDDPFAEFSSERKTIWGWTDCR
jgi:hypothetical protein